MKCICDDCKEQFELTGEEYELGGEKKKNVALLDVRACLSGGIYAIQVECPNCKYVHDLLH